EPVQAGRMSMQQRSSVGPQADPNAPARRGHGTDLPDDTEHVAAWSCSQVPDAVNRVRFYGRAAMLRARDGFHFEAKAAQSEQDGMAARRVAALLRQRMVEHVQDAGSTSPGAAARC